MVSIILKQALKKFKTSKEWELLQEYAGSEQAQADWELANSPEGKCLYKKAIASVKSALLKNAEKKPVEIPRKMRVLPLASITKNVGLNSKFDRERASVYNYYLNKYIEMIDSLDHNSPRIDPTQARNIALKKF